MYHLCIIMVFPRAPLSSTLLQGVGIMLLSPLQCCCNYVVACCTHSVVALGNRTSLQRHVLFRDFSSELFSLQMHFLFRDFSAEIFSLRRILWRDIFSAETYSLERNLRRDTFSPEPVLGLEISHDSRNCRPRE